MSSEKFSKDFVCCHKKHLPCQFGYLEDQVYRCRFNRLWVGTAGKKRDNYVAVTLLSQACPPIQEEKNFREYLIKLHKKRGKDLIKNANIGDILYCSGDFGGDGEVVLLEKPDTYMGLCRYRNKKGIEHICPPGDLLIISKGNYKAEYLAEGSNSEIKSIMIRILALQASFRVEIEKTESGHLVKIYGDNQKEVDDFMTLCVYNKLIFV